jgi:PPK2 family polyphosphate:nucleotide phosphotransferase
MSPLGFRAVPFKAPSEEEAAHDFLWRIHARVPKRGEMVAFNRSHYEDVLIRRVRKFDTDAQWRPRYGDIRAFEQLLARDANTVVVKFFLHVSKEEQGKRLRDRLGDPTKQWKFNPDDLKDRDMWDAYDRAYADALSETDADHAPWYAVPADHKWYRDLAVANVLHETLKDLKLEYPPPAEDLSKVVIE